MRQSPVTFAPGATRQVTWNGWGIVQEFADQGDGPWLVDLSHLPRWDYQHRKLDAQAPLGLQIPSHPGEVLRQGGWLVNRMNSTQVAIWQLDRSTDKAKPDTPEFTETTEAQCLLAVVGPDTQVVLEHVTNLDLFIPGRPMPFLTQGPVLHIPAQIVTLHSECVLVAFSRGYGQTFAEAMLHAASDCSLEPGGEDIAVDHLIGG